MAKKRKKAKKKPGKKPRRKKALELSNNLLKDLVYTQVVLIKENLDRVELLNLARDDLLLTNKVLEVVQGLTCKLSESFDDVNMKAAFHEDDRSDLLDLIGKNLRTLIKNAK